MPLILIVIFLGKLLTIAVGTYHFKRLTTPYRITFMLVVIAFLTESYGYYFSRYGGHNAWLFNFYILIEAWAMTIAGFYLISNRRIQRLLFFLLCANTLFWLRTLIANSVFVFANIPMATGCLFMAIEYVYILISDGIFNRANVIKQPLFWLSVSIILYCACVIPLMMMHGYLQKYAVSISVPLQHINSVLNIVRYALVAISFILLGNRTRVKMT